MLEFSFVCWDWSPVPPRGFVAEIREDHFILASPSPAAVGGGVERRKPMPHGNITAKAEERSRTVGDPS